MNVRSKKPLIIFLKKITSLFLKICDYPPCVLIVKNLLNLIIINSIKKKAQIYFENNFLNKKIIIKNKNKILVFFTCKNRYQYIKKNLSRLLKINNVDIVIIDGSDEIESIEFIKNLRSEKIKYKFFNVEGGPDVAIYFALLLANFLVKEYSYFSILESDTYIKNLKCFDLIINFFRKNKKIGVVSGINVKNCNFAERNGYSMTFWSPAGFLNFRKEILSFVLREYGYVTANDISKIIEKNFNINIKYVFSIYQGRNDYILSSDWGIGYIALKHNFLCISPKPSLAEDLDYDIFKLYRSHYQ
jgi:hypothetical protein